MPTSKNVEESSLHEHQSSEQSGVSQNLTSTIEENARIAYQTTISLSIAEAQHIWSRFNVMLVANSIIVAIIGSMITNQQKYPLLVMTLILSGIILCIVWFLLMQSNFEYQRYMVLSAREIEEKYLHPIKTISQGGHFISGKPVALQIEGKSVTLQKSPLTRHLRDRIAAYLVMVIFIILYIVLFIQA